MGFDTWIYSVGVVLSENEVKEGLLRWQLRHYMEGE